MTTTNKTYFGRLMMVAIFGAMLLLCGLDSKAQTTPPKNYARPVNAPDKYKVPKFEGTGEKLKNEAELKAFVGKQKITRPPAERAEKPAKARTRGSDARNQCGVGDYKGVCGGLWQFENDDFPSTGNTCGQAAAATIITHWQNARNDTQFKTGLASFLYTNYGPDNAWGALGTSWQQVVNSVVVPYHLSWRKSSGEDDLRAELNKGIPVIVMLDAGRLVQKGYTNYQINPTGIAGHWVVVYGYDSGFYYITNHEGNYINRADFLEAWNTWIHGGIDGGLRGYVFWK